MRRHIVLFSGGSGTATISKALVESGDYVTIVVNCYDDGKSTGRIRRAVPGMLGPSDVRKNVARFSSAGVMLETRDWRATNNSRWIVEKLTRRLADIWPESNWVDCPPGNLIFADYYLRIGDFNATVDRFCAGWLTAPGVRVLNVTQGENLHLSAMREDGKWYSEAGICSASDSPIVGFHLQNSQGDVVLPKLNPLVRDVIALADVIIYGPGTQYSSLLPSYVTLGLGNEIAKSRATKLYVANVARDTDIPRVTIAELCYAMIGAIRRGVIEDLKWGELVDAVLYAADSDIPIGDFALGSVLSVPRFRQSDGRHDGAVLVDVMGAVLYAVGRGRQVAAGQPGAFFDSATAQNR
jgi:2-phospho-L-lactate transferase/gluconeogenesis factor (CofD/UPF0052 family)